MPSLERVNDGERGMALVTVIWVLALLSVLALGFVATARTDLRIARNQVEAASAQTIADAGVTLALLGVLDPAPDKRWHADGRPYQRSYGGGRIDIRVEDEGGKIDLNAAPRPMLQNLFANAGVGSAEGLAEAILAQRKLVDEAADKSHFRRAEGQSRPMAFLAIDELRELPGMTYAAFARVAPFVTVYSENSSPDPNTAPAEVLLALPDAKLEQVRTTVAQRMESWKPGSVAAQQIAVTDLQAITIVSTGTTARGTSFVREAIVRLTGDRAQPYRILAWRRGDTGPRTVLAAR